MHILIKNKSLTYNNYKVKCALGKRGIGIKKKEDGSFFPKSLDPQSKEFEDLQDGDDALEAYNINKFKGNIDAYEDIIDVDTDVLIAQHEREEKKENNDDKRFLHLGPHELKLLMINHK